MDKPATDTVPSRLTVLILDPLVLRRAALLSLLAAWAVDNNATLLDAPPDARPESGPRCALAVLSLGGLPARDPQALGWLAQLAQELPDTPVAVLSDLDAAEEAVAALRAGARGFLPASTEPEIALHALTFIMRGGSYFPPGAMLSRGQNAGSRGGAGGAGGGLQMVRDAAVRHRPAGVSETEEAILGHLREGLSNRAIGRLLGMPEPTVKVHVRHLLRRFGAANRTQVALAAYGAVQAAAGVPANDGPPFGQEAVVRRPVLCAVPVGLHPRLKGVA